MKVQVLHMKEQVLHRNHSWGLVQELPGYKQEPGEIHIHPSLLQIHMKEKELEQEHKKVQELEHNLVWGLACKMALVLVCNVAWAYI